MREMYRHRTPDEGGPAGGPSRTDFATPESGECFSPIEEILDELRAGRMIVLVDDERRANAILVRIHSQCTTGDIFASTLCDCGPQLHQAVAQITALGTGVLLYMRQEGRGIGLLPKLQAYRLQQQEGLDTVDANTRLGYGADTRHYGIGAQIMHDLGVRKIRLMTNNPRKVTGLEAYGLHIVERVPIQIPPNQNNRDYLKTKKSKLGHLLDELDSGALEPGANFVGILRAAVGER